MKTLQSMLQSKARVLALEAGNTIVVDIKDMVSFANRHGITIVGVDENDLTQGQN
ncbi:MAG: DUF1009 domain-containing protein [Nitrospirae bacterium]|nr:MAG: DUF1009 domain-containing protein [Nitrospirota bacterium]